MVQASRDLSVPFFNNILVIEEKINGQRRKNKLATSKK